MNMSQAHVRPATLADAPRLAELGERIFRDTFAPDNRPEDLDHYLRTAFSETIQRAEIADATFVTLVIEVEAELVGYAQLRATQPPPPIEASGTIELRRFYIERAHHGRGLAQTLMAAVERAAIERDATGIWLGVWERNPRAISFYRKCGFLDVGSHVFVLGSDPQTDRIMLRPLRSSDGRLRAPERLFTPRLVLERPRGDDAEAIFGYASDPAVTPYVAFPRHRSIDDARWFIGFSDAEWARAPAGPYVIRDRGTNALIGSTGLVFETRFRAATGYVLARDAWGRGYATEALGAMVDLARTLGVRRLLAHVHPEHTRSARVLEKGGFALEGVWRLHDEFPNLTPGEPSDVSCYVRLL
jgi:RimJ/RimL family protein N-acetyltransferase